MSWIDIVVIVWAVAAAVRGRSLGALTQLLGFLGFVVGLAIGSVVAVPIAGRLTAGPLRTIVTLGIILGVAVLAGFGGRVLGKWANVTMRRLHLGSVDAVAGAAVGVLAALLSAWLVAGLFTQSSIGWLTGPIQRSAVLTTLDAVLPPLPAVVARAQAFLSTEAFPAAFAAITPPRTSSVSLPTPRGARDIAASVAGSVDKVLASGNCSVTREGTTFVVAPGLVVTNAHVVAGESHVDVVTSSGAVASTVVLFDPQLDVAILRVPGLQSRPVSLDAEPAAVGTHAAVVGFPENGARTAQPAGVAESFLAQGRDIYGGSLVTRPIYAVTATVLPGNSGSPLVAGGRAIGMVFSRSLTQTDLAYAIEASALVPEVRRAQLSPAAASTGACTPN